MNGSSARNIDSSRAEILEAAARLFMARGYAATSIDDVARSLDSTKGRIYHHFASKADLFAEVFRAGMEMNYDRLEPVVAKGGAPSPLWTAMAQVHARQMIETQHFQRVVWMGVEMHLLGATTPEQRATFEELIEYRTAYGRIFREVLRRGRDEGAFSFRDPSIANQLMFMTLNSPIFWYSRRPGETPADIDNLIEQVVQCAYRGLGGKEDTSP